MHVHHIPLALALLLALLLAAFLPGAHATPVGASMMIPHTASAEAAAEALAAPLLDDPGHDKTDPAAVCMPKDKDAPNRPPNSERCPNKCPLPSVPQRWVPEGCPGIQPSIPGFPINEDLITRKMLMPSHVGGDPVFEAFCLGDGFSQYAIFARHYTPPGDPLHGHCGRGLLDNVRGSTKSWVLHWQCRHLYGTDSIFATFGLGWNPFRKDKYTAGQVETAFKIASNFEWGHRGTQRIKCCWWDDKPCRKQWPLAKSHATEDGDHVDVGTMLEAQLNASTARAEAEEGRVDRG